jgi:hypothetical protein
MISKTTYAIKSYQVGLDKKSLADIMPAKIYTEHNGSTWISDLEDVSNSDLFYDT